MVSQIRDIDLEQLDRDAKALFEAHRRAAARKLKSELRWIAFGTVGKLIGYLSASFWFGVFVGWLVF